MIWGMVGKNVWAKHPRAKPRAGEITHGYIRDLDPGVEHKSLADCNLAMPTWQPLRDEDEASFTAARRWIMTLGQSEAPVQVTTLGQLSARVREAHRRNEPALRQLLSVLDDAVGQLLELADQLHAQQRCLGLLHPNNIMVFLPTADGAWRVALPDVGFAWRWQGAGNKPDWLNMSHPDVKVFADLWDAPPEEWNKRVCKQQWPDAPQPAEEWNPAQDVRLLARLLYWVLTGEVCKVVPAPNDRDPRSKLPTLVPLADALNGPGKITATRQLKTALKSSGKRPSDFFAEHEMTSMSGIGPRPASRTMRVLGFLGLAAVAIAVVASAVFLMPQFFKPDEPHKYTGLTKASKLYPYSDALEESNATLRKESEDWKEAQASLARWLELLDRLFKEKLSNAEAIRKKETEVLAREGKGYCDRWLSDVLKWTKSRQPVVRKDQARRYVAEIEEFQRQYEQFTRLGFTEDAACVEKMGRFANDALGYYKTQYQREERRWP